ncbi:alpha/beta hydrolase family protein [Paraburkholderia sp. BCC1886]|uniref:alpha/beta hydrolase family protein n=1 Tax=Paraburkholderia sp. BCC1886 TaxID=2562670 RepID=UPI001182A490|nr:alpha/beta fold hydrolase [Paraburkholderia sp. BCC1886]
MKSRRLFFAVLAAFTFSIAHAQDSTVRFEHFFIPMKQGFFGAKLSTYLYLPPGQGPFPLVVLNHGKSPGGQMQPDTMFKWQARVFLERGYAVLAPNRPGLGKSTGGYISGCDVKDNARVWAESVQAAIDYARKLPEIDDKKIVVIGQSQGGITSVALGERNLPGVLGIVNFAGGSRDERCGGWEGGLVDSYKAYGADSTIPTIFFYGDNDGHWGDGTLSKQFFSAYHAGNPNSTYVDEGNFADGDAHHFFSKDGYYAWDKPLWQFFDGLGLNSQVIPADKEAVKAAADAKVFAKAIEQ